MSGRSLALAAVAAAALAVTANGLANEFLLDDHIKIVNNTDIRRLGELPGKLLYPYQRNQVLERNDPSRPLVYLVYGLLYSIGGTDPVTFHLANALLHALAAILVFLLAARVQKLALGEGSLGPPLAAGLLFAVLPIQVGTVAYAYGLSDVLSGALVLASMYAFLRKDTPSRVDLFLSAASMGLAVLAKQSAALIPLFLLLFDAFFRREALRRRLVLHLPNALVLAGYLAFRFAYFGALGDLEGMGNTHGTLDYLVSEPPVVWRYLALTFVPHGLAIDHYVVPASYGVAAEIAAGVGLAAVGAGLVFLWRRRTGPARVLLFGLLFYFAALAPTSSFLPTVDLMVERRVYLATFGLCVVVALGVARWRKRFAARRALLALGGVALGAYTAGLAVVSALRNATYADNRSAWSDVLRSYPESPRALNNLANLHLERREFDAARAIYERLVARDPSDCIALGNLGSLYDKAECPCHDVERAAAFFRRAIASNPEYAAAHYNLARVYQKTGRRELAEQEYKKTLALNPNYVLAHNNLGLLYYHAGRPEEARARYLTALRLDPSCKPAKNNLKLLESRPAPVPPAQVSSEVLVRLYESALAKQPENLAIRKKYAELCIARRLPCAGPQLEWLKKHGGGGSP